MKYRLAFLFLVLMIMLPALTWAAPISVDIDKNVNLQLGTKLFGDPENGQTPIPVPNDLSICTLAVDRSQWTDPAASLRFKIWVSVNGGQTWPYWIQGTADGRPAGTESSVTMKLPPGTGRVAKGEYEVQGARFRATVSVRCQ